MVLRLCIKENKLRSQYIKLDLDVSRSINSDSVWFFRFLQLFKRLKYEVPKFYHKVSVMNGNLEAPGLGLSDEDKRKLSEEVNIIFHGAATVRFDEKLNVAVRINVLGTREMIKLAKSAKNLKVNPHFIYKYRT